MPEYRDYPPEFVPQSTQNYSQEQVFTEQPVSMSASQSRSMLSKAFIWMFAGLLATAATAFLLYFTDITLMLLIATNASFIYFISIAQLIEVIAFTAMLQKAKTSTLKVLFILYSVTMGVTLSAYGYIFEPSTILAAIAVTAVYFGSLAVIGMTTKLDLSKIGTLCMGFLVALVITQLVMLFIPSITSESRLISVLALLIFTGLTAWDVQKLSKLSNMSFDSTTTEKLSIYFALELYLDFINIFLRILSLLNMGKKN